MATTLTTGKNLPPPQSPFVDPSTGVLSNDGYQYFINLLNQIGAAIPTASLGLAIAAQGVTQATATPLTAQWNVVTSANNGTGNVGVLLDALQPGQSQTVFNETGGVIINIYPPPGTAIDALAVNVPYQLGNGKMQIFNFESATQIFTTQLQIP